MVPRSLGIAAVLLAASHAAGQTVTVRFTNNQPAGGFSTSPLWFGVHNGLFDFFNSGSAASAATEAMAELGSGAGLTEALGNDGFAGTVATDPEHPQFTPGETGTATINILNPTVNRWFSFASMIVPSNDFFVGNDDAQAYEIFDAAGNFRGPLTIQIFGRDGWEAHTEVNDVNVGPAFLVGRDAAGGVPETGVIQPLFSVPGNEAYILSIVGMQTPVYTVTHALAAGDLLGTIVITPAPSSAAAMALAAMLAGRRRRR
jgi:hypothetical protein